MRGEGLGVVRLWIRIISFFYFEGGCGGVHIRTVIFGQ